MMRTPENIVRHELIGLKVKVFKTKVEKGKGRVLGSKIAHGRVIDEGKNVLEIEDKEKGSEKEFIKKDSSFVFSLPEGSQVKVDGKLLQGTPEDRLKKDFPKKWDTL